MNDILHGLRLLRRRGGFSLVVVLTLAVGVGANSAILAVIDAVLLRPFPYPDQSQLVFVSGASRQNPSTGWSLNLLDMEDLRSQSRLLEEIGGAKDASFTVATAGEVSRIKGAHVSPQTLALLGMRPVLGRLLDADDDRPGAVPVCVLGDAAWERFFARDKLVLGKSIVLDGRAHTVVGIMPRAFKFWDASVYAPLHLGIPDDVRSLRGAQMGFWGVGRLKPGVKIGEAATELDSVARRIEAAFPGSNRDSTFRVRSLAEGIGSSLKRPLLLLLGASVFVLAMACTNAAHLLMTAGLLRSREFALRCSMGASRRRLAWQIALETVPLGVLSGAAGLLIGTTVLKVLAAAAPARAFPAESTLEFGPLFIVATPLVAVLLSVTTNLVAAFRATSVDATDVLKSGGHGATRSRGSGFVRPLVVAQVALAFCLVVGSGLLLRSFLGVARTDLGFEPAGTVVATVELPTERYPDSQSAARFQADLLERLRTTPGVVHAGAMVNLPFAGARLQFPAYADQTAYDTRAQLKFALYTPTTPGAMEALGMRLRSGRFFNASDRRAVEPVAIINASAERALFGDAPALGRRVASGLLSRFMGERKPTGLGGALLDPAFTTIVGTVEDTRHNGLPGTVEPEVFYPFEQCPPAAEVYGSFVVIVSGPASPAQKIAAVRGTIRSLDPEIPSDSASTVDARISATLSSRRFLLILLGVFAAMAIGLAASGIYAATSFMVAERTREMGIRFALGASQRSILWNLLRQGIASTAVGIAGGLLLSATLSGLIRANLVGVSATDPATLFAVATSVFAIALVACWFPARRAARVDPMVALRSE